MRLGAPVGPLGVNDEMPLLKADVAIVIYPVWRLIRPKKV